MQVKDHTNSLAPGGASGSLPGVAPASAKEVIKRERERMGGWTYPTPVDLQTVARVDTAGGQTVSTEPRNLGLPAASTIPTSLVAPPPFRSTSSSTHHSLYSIGAATPRKKISISFAYGKAPVSALPHTALLWRVLHSPRVSDLSKAFVFIISCLFFLHALSGGRLDAFACDISPLISTRLDSDILPAFTRSLQVPHYDRLRQNHHHGHALSPEIYQPHGDTQHDRGRDLIGDSPPHALEAVRADPLFRDGETPLVHAGHGDAKLHTGGEETKELDLDAIDLGDFSDEDGFLSIPVS